MIESLQKGDILIVSELSRLGRSMLEIMEILSVATEKGIHIFAVKGNWQLDNSIQSKVLAMAFAMASEIERDLIASRTKEALAAKKRAGVELGRPRGWRNCSEGLATPLTYVVVNFLKRQEQLDVYDHDSDFNPFKLQA